MRLDKFLKVSRIVKRRTVANELCDAARVTANGRTARASYEVKPGDVLELSIAGKIQRFRVLSVDEQKGKDASRGMYEVAQ